MSYPNSTEVKTMPDYQKMYTTLFNKITDMIEELQKIQQLTEEMYMQDEDKAE